MPPFRFCAVIGREGRVRTYIRPPLPPPIPMIIYVGETINLEFKSYPSPGMTRMNRYAMPGIRALHDLHGHYHCKGNAIN